MQKKSLWEQYKMPILLLGGISIGALIGIIAPDFGTKLKPLGDIFLNLMFTIVVPLVFASIASAVGAMANMKRLGKILGSTLLTFLVTGAFAGACVLIWVNLFNPAAGASIQMGEAEMGQMQSAGDMIVGALTVSDFSQLLSKSNMLPLIIFSVIFGFCVSSISRDGEENIMCKWMAGLNDVILKFVGVIMKVASIGLGAYFANLIAVYGPELIGDYGRSMVVYYPLCLLYVVIFFPLYALFAAGKTGLTRMMKYILAPAVTAFATQSSAAPSPSARRPAVISACRRMSATWFCPWAAPCIWTARSSAPSSRSRSCSACLGCPSRGWTLTPWPSPCPSSVPLCCPVLPAAGWWVRC